MSNEEHALEIDSEQETSIQEDVKIEISNKLLTLPHVLESEKLDEVLVAVTEFYKEEDDLQIDASRIEQMNTASVQTFICINRYAQSNQKHLEWFSPSSSFMDAFNNLGLYSAMMKMEMK